jgi:Tol biopolymer transport system component
MRFVLTAAVVALLTPFPATHAQTPQELFQRALVAERSAGRLPDAIALYRRVVREAGTNRALTAQALVRLGAAYEMQGRSEARAAYDRVVREYSDQTDFVAQARQRLAALERQAAANGARGRAFVAREVWSDENITGLNAVSRDGRFVAFTDWGTGDLAVRDLQENATRHLTSKGSWEESAQFAEVAVISPDGERIAYAWFTDAGPYELRTIATSGGAPRTIPLPSMYYLSVYDWMPDGSGILAVLEQRGGDAVLAIVRHDGSFQQLAPINLRFTSGASVSPDGRWVVYDVAEEDEKRNIMIVGMDGSAARLLVTHAANDWKPSWTPDGSAVAFLSDRAGGRGLWTIPVTNGSATGAATLVKSDMGLSELIGLSRSGTMFYMPGSPRSNLMVAEVDLDSLRVRPPRQLGLTYEGSNWMPDWSPDGQRLAFFSFRGPTGLPGERVLVTTNLQGTQTREFPITLLGSARPRWFADGRRVMISGRIRGERQSAKFSFDVESSTLTQLTRPELKMTLESVLSADERTIVYVRTDSGNRATVRRVTLATGADELVYAAEGRSAITSLSVSPDDRWIAGTVRENIGTARATVRTMLLDREGRVIRPLTSGQAAAFSSINWSPDSRSLIAVARMPTAGREAAALGSRFELVKIPIDGSATAKFGFETTNLGQLRLSRDGKRIAFISSDPAHSVVPSIWAIDRVVPPAP